jgi:hypothetical protein
MMVRRTTVLPVVAAVLLGGCHARSDARGELEAQRKRTDALVRELVPLFVDAAGGEFDKGDGEFKPCNLAPMIAATYQGGANIDRPTATPEEIDAALLKAGWEHVDVEGDSPFFLSWDIKKGNDVVGVSYRLENPAISFGVSNECVDIGDQDIKDEFLRSDPTVYTAP